jgi:hypothetical protein
MKSRNFYRIIIGALMVAGGLVTLFIPTYLRLITNGDAVIWAPAGDFSPRILLMTDGEAVVGTILLCAGIVFLITGIVRHRKDGDFPESDERSKRIGAYGITYAWLTGLFFMFILFWLDYLNVFRMSAQNALVLSILVLTLSAKIYQIYLFRKGDVE